MRVTRKLNNKGQSIMEYAIIIGLVVTALSAMQVYVKRSIQAGIKVAADELGTQQDDAGETDPEEGIWTQATIHRATIASQNIKVDAEGTRTYTYNNIAEIKSDSCSTSEQETEQ